MNSPLKQEDLINWLKTNPRDVSIKPSKRYPELRVVKYRNSVFYDDTWNQFLEECRGLVIDEDWNIVALPLRKMYNHGLEKRAPDFADDEEVYITPKVNGFMAAVSLYKDKLLYSTTGSLDSDFVDMAEKILKPHERWMEMMLKSDPQKATLVFEICHPNDPHIIPEKVGATLLAIRKHKEVLDESIYPPSLPLRDFTIMETREIIRPPAKVEVTKMKFSDVKEMVNKTQTEGVVIYETGRSEIPRISKIKSPYYLIKKFFARAGKTERLLGKSVFERYPEEYYPLIRHIQDRKEAFMEMEEQKRLEWIRKFLKNPENNQLPVTVRKPVVLAVNEATIPEDVKSFLDEIKPGDKPKALFLRGAPGSGKSTLAQKIIQDYPNLKIKHFEADQYFLDEKGNYCWIGSDLKKAHEWCYNSFMEASREADLVIVSNTFSKEKELAPYINYCKQTQMQHKEHICTGEFKSIHDVPQKTVEAMRKRLGL